ncbi:Cupredoxin [Cercophora newfieldiana]|uniref:Cupredoxin n=1 Tax=Cercophora newfieldiana TaxID=92897 RepID=A0AA39XX74_9PEZI|nr:Cupredoxin [Cercophora newfieldiana]
MLIPNFSFLTAALSLLATPCLSHDTPMRHERQVATRDILYYEVEIKSFQHTFFPGLEPATLVGYDGMSPGPTFIIPRGTESIVRFINNASTPNSVHLHGSYSRAPFDGWAEDVTQPGEYKDYYFPNAQAARTMWYHDHAVHITAENAYMGQAGMYLIHDPAEDALGLPSGYGVHDIPLVLSSKQYNANGTLFSTVGERISLWGDTLHVNGQPWPYLSVSPRPYRFRFLNAAVSRTFALYFVTTTSPHTNKIPFHVIASDSGLLEKPIPTSTLYLSMAERYEIVFDFSRFAGQTIELRNFPRAGGAGTETDYESTHQVMRFVVAPNDNTTSPSPSPPLPTHLRTIPYPLPTNRTHIAHRFKFHRANGKWLINNTPFSDPANRILASVPEGTVETWELENTTDGWSHPVHIHLVDFRILSRHGHGVRGVTAYERAGLKDVVWLGREEKVLVEAHYAPWEGTYMMHCHNLVHEDDDMMVAFNVTGPVGGKGKGKETGGFEDPMEGKWRAKGWKKDDVLQRKGEFSDAAIAKRVKEMVDAKPYEQGEGKVKVKRAGKGENSDQGRDGKRAGRRRT